MSNYTSLEQAQAALAALNLKASEIKNTRDTAFENQRNSLVKLTDLKKQYDNLTLVRDQSSEFSAAYIDASAQLLDLSNEIKKEETTFSELRFQVRRYDLEGIQIRSEQEYVNQSIRQFETPGEVVTNVEAVNPDTSAAESVQRNQNSEILGDTSPQDDNASFGVRPIAETNPGAMPSNPQPGTVNVTTLSSKARNVTDMRVKIRVPASYLTTLTNGPTGSGANDNFPVSPLKANGGILFPYTPAISYSHKADYTTQSPLHSNFALNFYKNSSVTSISVSGDFTVQNEKEAAVYLATVHLLRALTKMRSGGIQNGDPDSGAPPPVCRLDAYGEFMLDNVPVVITEFTVDLPNSVDYFTIGKKTANKDLTYGTTAVPVKSTIKITCLPMYSRKEIQEFSVSSWLNSNKLRKGGYL